MERNIPYNWKVDSLVFWGKILIMEMVKLKILEQMV